MNKKILIATSTFGINSPEPIKLLKKNNIDIVFNPKKRKLRNEELKKYLKDCEGVIAGTEEYSMETIEDNKTLKVISRLGSGIDNIDLKLIKRKKIIIIKTKTTPNTAVAELTIGLMINLLRKISLSNFNIRNKVWRKETGNLLMGKTVGIIGMGKIGKKLALLLQSFDVKIIVYDLKIDNVFCKKNKCIPVSLKNLSKNADVISLHTNLSKKNKAFFNKDFFKPMKRSAVLINTSRGELINEQDLKWALDKKEIAGAALDVFNDEPYTGELIKYNNVILTPHIGGYALETRNRMELEAVKNLIKKI